MLKKVGNSFCLIQHVQIRLEHISKHFYQKMLSQVTFSGFPASLLWSGVRGVVKGVSSSIFDGNPDHHAACPIGNLAITQLLFE